MNIGVIGGTFDPVHRAHLALAEEARTRFNMAEVFFLPAGQPYFKDTAHISPAEHRVNMLRLAIQSKPYFKLSMVEIERRGPSYAIDSVSQIKSRYNPLDEVYFLLGMDSYNSLPLWQEPQKLISLCRLVVAPRPGYPPPDMQRMESAIPGISARTTLLDKPEMNISATEIRERVKTGQPISRMVLPAVEQYIRQHGLYRQ